MDKDDETVDHRNPKPKDIRVMPWTLAACEVFANRMVATRFARKGDKGATRTVEVTR